MKDNIIVVAGQKGGIGKSPISVGIASSKRFNFNLFTNETSILENTYSKTKVFLPKEYVVEIEGRKAIAHINELPVEKNTVYDFKGNIDVEVTDLTKVADVVILPVFDNDDSISKAVIGLIQLNEMIKETTEIIIVATRVKNDKKFKHIFETFQNELKTYYQAEMNLSDEELSSYLDDNGNFPITFLKLSDSEMYNYLQSKGKTIEDIKENRNIFTYGGLKANTMWKSHIKEFEDLLDCIEEKLK